MCSGPKWKREVVPDHKFDFVDTREFTDNGFMMRMKYLWLYLLVLKNFLVYISDIFSAVTMLTTKTWSNEIFNRCAIKKIQGCIPIPFVIGKWLFVGCIIFSFLLLAYESRKAKKIIASRDISYAFTNVMANNYYSLRSYDHFCFFDHISNSTKTSDDFAFFVFFVFKSWKRVLLADGPRQSINALTLYSIFLSKRGEGEWYDIGKYFRGNALSTSLLTVTTFFTVVVFAGSLALLIVAAICYVPLLCHIRGNLKEYCCHKVDKRISTVIKRRQKQRLADAAKLAQKEALGDYSHLKNKKGELIAQPLPQPTLPNLSVDDDDDYSSMHTRVPPGSTYTYNTQDQYYYNSDKNDYPPPMPAYNPYSTHQAPGAPQYNPSYDDAGYYQSSIRGYGDDESIRKGDQYSSPIDRPGTANYLDQPGYMDRPGTANFANPRGAMNNQSYDPHDRPGTANFANPRGAMNNQSYEPRSAMNNQSYDPHDVYQGRALTSPDGSRRGSPAITSPRPSPGGLAYDYPSPGPNSQTSHTLYETSPSPYNYPPRGGGY